MNFRTTLLLLVLVIAAGIVLFFVNKKTPEGGEAGNAQASGNEHKLMDVDSKDVTRIAITNSEGKRTVLEKTGNNWSLVEPVKAGAKDFEVESLLTTLTGLQSRGQVDPSQKTAGGLDHPSFTIELTGKNNAVTKLLVGEKQPFGDTLLVQLNDNKKPDVVNTSLYTSLDKPASTYRKSQLVDVTQDQIKQLSITKGNTTIKAEKKGNDWEIIEPKAMPADSSAMSDLLFGITGLNATEFVTDDASKAAQYRLNAPRLSVWYSTQAPTTQPSATSAPATEPAGVTIRFGDYEDVLKKNIFAEVAHGPIAKVPVSSETTFNKTPLDLRDKNVVNIDPEKVQSITISMNKSATTQPTSRPAEIHEFVIERRKEEAPVLGPNLPIGAAPTTQPAPATRPATTQPSTEIASSQPATQSTTQPAVASSQPATRPAVAASQPATQPASKWLFASGGQGDAEEGQVNALLTSLHPLRVEKYLDKSPTTQPAGAYSLTLRTTDGKEYALHFIDPGAAGKVVGSYEDLSFELDHALTDKLAGDFKTKKPELAPSPTPNFGNAGSPFGR
jgi:hypothetical protein